MSWREAATRAAAAYARLALGVRRGMGERLGERRFPGRPQVTGIEVESWAAYTPGEDLRHLDWNAFARLDTLVLRRFTAEREVTFDLLLDASASMGVPARDRKLAVACELALALATIALGSRDAVRLTVLGRAPEPVLRGRASLLRVAERLDAVAAGGALDLGGALTAHARRAGRPGAALVVSDLMTEPGALDRGVQALRARGWELALLHVIGREELEPGRDFTRALVEDAETGETHPVALTTDVRARYQAVLAEHLAALARIADAGGALYARLPTDGSVADFVAGDLARLGLVRRR
jgi:uncharacterized protein (DUF58 family)